MKHRLTASRIRLGRSCLWWARPDVELPEQDETSAAAVGTAFHWTASAETDAAAEDTEVNDELVAERFRVLVCGGAEADAGAGLDEAERKRLAALAASWREWWSKRPLGETAESEVPYALSAAGEARELESKGPRDYSAAREDEIPGTADVVGLVDTEEGVALFVGDYKTGHGHQHLEDHLDQLTHLGACEAKLTADPEDFGVVVGVIHVTPSGVHVESKRLDSFDIALHVEEMRELLEQLPTAEPRPGLHCDELYCPARAVCPATRALLVTAGVELEPRRRLPLVGPVQENDEALAILVAAPLLEAWLADRVKAARAYADAHDGVKAPDGRVYRGRPVQRETPRVDVAGALEAMRRVLGADADKAVKTKVTTSFTAITEVIQERRARGEKLPIKDTVQHVREALREAHALKVSEWTQYDWADERPKTKKRKGD